MSGAEIKAHNVQFDTNMASGIEVGKQRKQRSDRKKKRTGEEVDRSGGKKQKVNPQWSRQFPPAVNSWDHMNHGDFEGDMRSG